MKSSDDLGMGSVRESSMPEEAEGDSQGQRQNVFVGGVDKEVVEKRPERQRGDAQDQPPYHLGPYGPSAVEHAEHRGRRPQGKKRVQALINRLLGKARLDVSAHLSHEDDKKKSESSPESGLGRGLIFFILGDFWKCIHLKEDDGCHRRHESPDHQSKKCADERYHI